MKKLILFLSSGFGSGYIPGMPGTYGTIVAAGCYWFLKDLPPALLLVTVITFIFFSVWVAHLTDLYLGTKDNSVIVIDEFAGFFVTMLFVPFSWKSLAIGFLLFRIFDIWKPFPIRKIQDNVPGGWGVVGDDVLAGVYANVVLQIFNRLISY